jgi:hypothetical protein
MNMRQIVTAASLLVIASVCGHAQWLTYRSPGTPRARDGKANLSAPPPRASNGKPDLSGVWQVEPTPFDEMTKLFGDFTALSVPGDDPRSLTKYTFNILADFKRGEEPILPEAAEAMRLHPKDSRDIPTSYGLPGGIPFVALLPIPFKIVQTPGLIVMLFTEVDGTIRQIYTDGRKPPADPQPLWLGYSVGKWDGDAMVVDTTGFNDKGWMDGFGHTHSEALHVVERYRRRDFGHLDVQVTIEDPKTYTHPFTIKYTELLLADSDITESYCAENEKDRQHLTIR